MREIGRRRQRQVRDALVRTLEGLGDQRAAAVSVLLAEGKQPAAAEEIARLELRVQAGQGARRVGRRARGRVIEARAAPAAARRIDHHPMSGPPRQRAGGPDRGSIARMSS
jgi:hypothetical protein